MRKSENEPGRTETAMELSLQNPSATNGDAGGHTSVL